VIAIGAAHVAKVTRDVDGAAAHDNGTHAHVADRRPRQHRAGAAVKRGDAVARHAADGREQAARVQRRAAERERLHGEIGAGTPWRDAAVGEHVREIRARHSADHVERTADEPAARAVGHHGIDLAADLRGGRDRRSARAVERHAASRCGAHAREITAEVNGVADAGDGVHGAVGDPERRIDDLRARRGRGEREQAQCECGADRERGHARCRARGEADAE
jgi:hypothetical protein